MLPESLRRLAFSVAGATVLALVSSTSVLAQGSTGKIQGRVVDAQSGQPIAAAQVEVVGTNRGNITNDEGFYFINEVPAGLMDIRAVSIGYGAVVVNDQRVLAGQTLTQNFSLEPTAVEIEAIVIQGERNPLVPRDQVSSRAIVTGETIENLPLDQASSIVALQPGVITTNSGVTIRGSRANEQATYVDGVLVRRFQIGAADPLELPTNALAQLDVTTGGISARFSNAQSGLVNYTTRTGGSSFSGAASFFTDRFAPSDWRTYFNRGELSLGGPLFAGLNFFLAGVAEGQEYGARNAGINYIVAEGVDSVFTLARSSGTPGASDSIQIVFPNFVDWDHGRTFPFSQSDEITALGKLSMPVRGGSRVDLSYYTNRNQAVFRTTSELYNPEGWDGNLSTANVLTLGGYFVLAQTATQALALDLKASWQRYWNQTGPLNLEWLADHRDPVLGFNFSTVDFLVDADDWEVTEDLVELSKFDAMPLDSLQLFPGRQELAVKQGYIGVGENLRINPYGARSGGPGLTGFSLSGMQNAHALEYTTENNLVFNGSVDWQAGRYNRIFVGGDVALVDARRMALTLFSGRAAPMMNEPVIGGAFIQDRLDLGDVVLEGGLRLDFFKPDGEFPRVPGYVSFVPDSLTRDRMVAGTDGQLIPYSEQLVGGSPRGECNANFRTDGSTTCLDNFIEAETKSELSPRLAVSFPVTANSTFRMSYSHNVQVPSLQRQGFGGFGSAAGQGGAIFADVFTDFATGLANTNSLFGRDVDMPRTVLFEAGYRQLFGENLVVDIAAYTKTLRNGLTYRKIQFEDPVRGNDVFINSLVNADYALTRGVDLRVDRRFGEIADVTLNYSFLDARGTGSDPFTYTALLVRGSSNLSGITGQPVRAPEALFPLEQSRTHNFSGTLSLLFPDDYGDEAAGLLSDVGVFATFSAASGLPYTRLLNQANGQVGPPTFAGLGGTLTEPLGASEMPWERHFDVRVHKGFQVAGTRMRVFADVRNPFDIENTNRIFLETGTAFNDEFRRVALATHLGDQNLDGDSDIDDFNIMAEFPGNELNRYALVKAEERFGDGDGVFTVEEQERAFGAYYDLVNGRHRFIDSNQSLRLGVEVVF
ncbi:MAG TPA: carboxypeptidase regulatory-like domain-containing protein [Longimicrobiales bacterium]|nr:carboxypeptidase regulatory-like domain-containing protein [Longimicrobiales bacterium]